MSSLPEDKAGKNKREFRGCEHPLPRSKAAETTANIDDSESGRSRGGEDGWRRGMEKRERWTLRLGPDEAGACLQLHSHSCLKESPCLSRLGFCSTEEGKSGGGRKDDLLKREKEA